MTSTKPPNTIEDPRRKKVAVLIPCYNEEVTVGKVVADFCSTLPDAQIFVFDNNSTDQTALLASQAGATVVRSPQPGKGNVVRHMFATVEADVYLMVDGDDTYPAKEAGKLIDALEENRADMVVGMRLSTYDARAFRRMHKFGNRSIAKLISLLFSQKVTDVLSGYRIFSRDFVEIAHLKSEGFEIETEMTLQALLKKLVIKEVPISYSERPEGSVSKLNTFLDGIGILKAIVLIFKDYKPLVFFSLLSAVCFIGGLIAGWYPIKDYLTERYVEHVPLAILAASLEIMAVVLLGIGIILDTVAKYYIETQQLLRKLLRRNR